MTVISSIKLQVILGIWSAVRSAENGLKLKVEISDQVPKHLCKLNLHNTQILLNASAGELYRRTGVEISDVNVVLPSSWIHSECTHPDSLQPLQYDKVDVVVGVRDPVFGSSIVGVQYGGCGEEGLVVNLPFDTLVQGETVPRELVNELSMGLLKYKFGLFPSHGFLNDTRYPLHYKLGEVVLENKGCPDKQLLCGAESYDVEAPTKQNLLCGSKSPLQIIQELQMKENNVVNERMDINNDEASVEWIKPVYTGPNFILSAKTTTRYILVLENTVSMETRWLSLHNALHRFIMELSIGDELAVLTFSNSSRIHLDPTSINQENKPGIHGRVPGRAGTDVESCISCALRDAAKLISTSKTTETKIILVTSGESQEKVEIADNSVPVYAIAFRESKMETLVEITKHGKMFVIEDDDSALLAHFSDAFLTLKEGETKASKFFQQNYRVSPREKIEGKFTVEESLLRNLKVMSITKDKEDIETFELISPSGKLHRFPLVERGSVYFEFESRVEMGIWSFSIQPSLSTTKPSISLSISAYAEQSAESTITVTTWTNVDHGLSSPLDGPVLIYARVLEGNLPVSGVEVRAEIRKPQGELIEIILEDEGTGYPDVTMGDGIYTGYMTSFSSVSGFYSLVVRAEDGAGRARIPTQIVGQLDDCCGSNYPVVSSIPTPTFTRVVMGSSFYLTQGVQFFIRDGVPKIQDIFPPSRITDLRVHEYIQDSLEVVLSWSAPGGDYNTGTAARYSIRSSSDRDLLANGNFSLSGIPIHDSLIPKPELAGSQQFCTVTLPWGNEIFYYGIMAIDDGENTSPVSNLVSVFARELVIASEGSIGRNLTGSPGSLPSTVLEVFEDNLLVYIIAGCITGIVLIVLIVILISLRISRNKSNQKPKREFITEISSPTLIHSSSALTGILKDTSLSVIPNKSSPQDFSMDYAVYKSGLPGSPRDDVSWAILPTYTNSAFRKSSDTLVDSGYYRAGEQVDNVSEFYRPASDYVTYQNLKREEVTGDISDNGTGTTSSTDCENSETCSDKNLPNFQGLGKDTSRNAASEFHSLVVTGEDWRQGEGSKLSVSGPISLQGLSEYDLQEKRRRRESFV